MRRDQSEDRTGSAGLETEPQHDVHQRLSSERSCRLVAGNLSEQLRVPVIISVRRIVESVVVERILEVEPKLQVDPFRERKVLLGRSLRIEQSRSRDDIPTSVARSESTRNGKTTHIENRILQSLIESIPSDLVSQTEARHGDVAASQVRHLVSNCRRIVVVRAVR